MFGIHRVSMGGKEGHKWASDSGRFFLSLGGRVYLFHIEIGRFGITIEQKAGRA